MKSEDAPVSLLESLQYVFSQSGYQTDLIDADEAPEHPFEELIVAYSDENNPPELAVRLLQSSALIAPEHVSAKDGIDYLQLMINFPFRASSGPTAELDELLNHCNSALAQGRFVYSEQEGLLFQDVLPFWGKKVSPGQIADILETSGFLCQKYYAAFARLLQSQEPLAAILNDFPLGAQ